MSFLKHLVFLHHSDANVSHLIRVYMKINYPWENCPCFDNEGNLGTSCQFKGTLVKFSYFTYCGLIQIEILNQLLF